MSVSYETEINWRCPCHVSIGSCNSKIKIHVKKRHMFFASESVLGSASFSQMRIGIFRMFAVKIKSELGEVVKTVVVGVKHAAVVDDFGFEYGAVAFDPAGKANRELLLEIVEGS